MPMKWTAENNELLLYKILETSSVNADVKAISESWPTDRGEVPTPRAITERLCKIRANVKKLGNDTTAASPSTPRSIPSSTPRKPRAPRAKKADTVTAPSSKKRKRNDEDVAVTRKKSVKKQGSLNGISNTSGLYDYNEETVATKPMKDEIKVQHAAPFAHGVWNIIDEVDSDAEPGNVTDENMVVEEECV